MKKFKRVAKYILVLLIIGLISIFCFKQFFKKEVFFYKSMYAYAQMGDKLVLVSCQSVNVTHTILRDTIIFDFDKGLYKLKYKVVSNNLPLAIYAEDKTSFIKFNYQVKSDHSIVAFKIIDRIIVLSTTQPNCK